MAYTAFTMPMIGEPWGNPTWISSFNSFTTTAGTTASRTYTNRKKHSGGSYHYWPSDGAPDPAMDRTTPPYPKNQYTDHVVVEVLLQTP